MLGRTLAAISMRGILAAALLGLTACSGIDLGDKPSRDVTKQDGPLTIPPEHLKNGQSE
jgi:hypothetical protein